MTENEGGDMRRWTWGLMAAAIICGWLLPEFYDWSGEDQSRAAPVVRWIALVLLLFDAVAIGWLVWSHVRERRTTLKEDPSSHVSLAHHVFGIRHILIATSVIAVIVTAERMFKLPLANGLTLALVAYATWLAYRWPARRWEIVALLVCMWAPFLWVFRWPEFKSNMVEVLMMLPGVPMLLPAAFFNRLIGIDMIGDLTTTGLFSMFQLALGLWIVNVGSKPAIAYSLAAFTISLVSSFVLQALVRM